ncbi:MAG: thioredoxin family protein [Beijerinckiaceae bacterium]
MTPLPHPITRRALLAASGAGLALASAPQAAQAQAKLTDDGIYTQPWFVESFLDLADDLGAATKSSKRFAVIFELKGCPYCKDVHLINFADEAIRNYVRERFDIVQLNILGAREVTDFDGEKLTEKNFAAKYGVKFTPTFLFFAEDGKAVAARKPLERDVARWQGYLKPPAFKSLFAYVADREYEKGAVLRDYLQKAQG